MAVGVRLSATPELEAIQPTLDESLRRLEDELNALSPAEVAAVVEAAARALERESEPAEVPPVARLLAGGRSFSRAERVAAELEILQRSFARRRELLEGSLTASQVATLLHTSRQTPHDRVAAGSLLAVMDRGALRFPAWQFDPDGPDGVVAGLPSVIHALGVSPMAKISWLTRANTMLDGLAPLAALRSGAIQRVVALARGVGVA